jgi:two-component system sensor kinase FixL
MGDRIQLAQVVSNLIRNAADATAGQVVRSLRLTASLNDDNMVEVRIKDNGAGIPSHLMGKLFTPFTSSKAEGLGVGLSICRTIVEQHQGRIWAETLPLGTVFCFTLIPARHTVGKWKFCKNNRVSRRL